MPYDVGSRCRSLMWKDPQRPVVRDERRQPARDRTGLGDVDDEAAEQHAVRVDAREDVPHAADRDGEHGAEQADTGQLQRQQQPATR
jgi:hypothetical protein